MISDCNHYAGRFELLELVLSYVYAIFMFNLCTFCLYVLLLVQGVRADNSSHLSNEIGEELSKLSASAGLRFEFLLLCHPQSFL